MKFPDLVPDYVCTTPIKVYAVDGINEDGSPKESVLFDGLCNYAESAHTVVDAEKHIITLSAKALFNGDILPQQGIIEGYVLVNGKTKEIYASAKERNIDGSVNFTKLELK